MKHQRYGSVVVVLLLCSALLISFSLLSGCKGSTGSAGSTTGSISGVVTHSTGTLPLAGVTVSTKPDVGSTTTDANGNYSMSLPAGSYTITFSLTNFTSVTAAANVAVGTSTQINASLGVSSTGNPSVTLTSSATSTYVGYGATFTVTSTVNNPIGNTLTYKWKSATANASDPTTATATTPSLATALSGSAADPNTDPGGYITAYTQEDRLGVLPITGDTRGAKTVSLTVDDGQGAKGTGSLTVNAAGIQPGLRTVALGVPVYLNSGTTDTATTWSATPPSGSNVSTTLGGQAGRNPVLTPDVVGQYIITASTGSSITIYAGKWAGAIDTNASTVYTSKTVTMANGVWYGWSPSSTQSSFTYTNWPVVEGDPACLGCHDDSTAPDEFTPWKNTVHANFFSRGIENITSNGGTCLTCHTTGYDTVVNNNDGFDDMAKAEGFVYTASTKTTGAWAKLLTNDPKTARRANIQCENCHGPQATSNDPFVAVGSHTSTNSDPVNNAALRISFSSELCASCHASGTGHHNYSEWNTLDPDTGYGHSNMETAIKDGTNTSCGRCHSAQGYTQYLDLLNAGSAAASLTASAMTWTTPNYTQPVTCTACHDPHDNQGSMTNNQLRVYDETPLLPGGFKVTGFGKGAICVTCHNSRNGKVTNTTTYLHEDGQPMSTGATYSYNSSNGTTTVSSFSAPHQACQGDVFTGHNAYFMGIGTLPMLSKHANAEDACVGCHIVLNPQTHLSHGAPAVSGHVMYIRDQDKAEVCANCHSSNVTGEALVAWVESQLEALGGTLSDDYSTVLSTGLLGSLVKTKANAAGTINVVAWDPASDTYNSNPPSGTPATGFDIDVTANPITKVAIHEIHGQVGFILTFTTPVTIGNTDSKYKGPATMTTFGVQLGSLKSAGGASTIYSLAGHMVKAGWNYFLVEGDASKGIHNPSFVQGVLTNTYSVMSNSNNND